MPRFFVSWCLCVFCVPVSCVRSTLFSAQYRLSEIIRQVPEVLIILLTNVFLKLAGSVPRDVPGHGPRFRVRAGIIDRGFVLSYLGTPGQNFSWIMIILRTT